MIYSIDIPDGSNELKELQFVVYELNKSRTADEVAAGRPAPVPITEEEYLLEEVLGPLRGRVMKRYEAYVRKLSAAELESKLGPIDKVRSVKP